jgi:hypothetical protein
MTEFDKPKSQRQYDGQGDSWAKKSAPEERTSAPSTPDEKAFLARMRKGGLQNNAYRCASVVTNSYDASLVERDGERKIRLTPNNYGDRRKIGIAFADLNQENFLKTTKEKIKIQGEGKTRYVNAYEMSIQMYNRLLEMADMSSVTLEGINDVRNRIKATHAEGIDKEFMASTLQALKEQEAAQRKKAEEGASLAKLPDDVRALIIDYRSKPINRTPGDKQLG